MESLPEQVGEIYYALYNEVVWLHCKVGDKFRDLLFAILNKYAGIDLNSFKRDGSNKTLWEESSNVRELRHGVVHEAKTATAEDAVKALGIATVILRQIFPDVISNLGLHLHDGVVVCGKKH